MGKPLRSVRKYNDEPKWEDAADWLEFPDNKQIMIRVFGDVTVMARHWISTLSGKRFPMWCPQLDGIEEQYISSRPCPLHDDFDERSQKVMIGNCIVRELQERGDPNPVRAFMLPHAVNDDLQDICEVINADPGDVQDGVDLAVRYNSQAVGNKKWGIQRGNNTPLTKTEQRYRHYNFDAICPDYSDDEVAQHQAKTMRVALARNKYYVVQEQQVPRNARDPYKYFKGDVRGKPFTDFADLVAARNEREGQEKYHVTTVQAVPTASTNDSTQVAATRVVPPTSSVDDTAGRAETSAPVAPNGVAPNGVAPGGVAPGVTPNPELTDVFGGGASFPEGIGTMRDEQYGEVPECFRQYDGTTKCQRCSARPDCMVNSDEDL